jgi:hypothetical protein
MMKTLLKIAGFIFFPLLLSGQQLVVQMEGDVYFNENLPAISEAGTDYSVSLETQSTVNISVLYDDQLNKKNNPNEKWRVFLHKQDMEWNNNLVLEARRTGRGSRFNHPGNPNINDGENFQQVTNNPVYFFRGRGEIVQIPLALRLNGFSVTMGAGDFETSIVFTVYDEW